MENKKITFIEMLSIYLFACVMLLMVGCKKNNSQETLASKYGPKFNSIRKQLNVPIIEPTWINHENNDSVQFWTNKYKMLLKDEPHHFFKEVDLSENGLLYEMDDYNYNYNQDTAYGLLIYTYFHSDTVSERKYELTTYFIGKFPPTKSVFIEKNQLDSLENRWKIRIP